MKLNLDAIVAAHGRIADAIVRTPLARSDTLSNIHGIDLYLKFENQQFTSSFKERGALNRLLTFTKTERERGVVAMSAGNHAQAVAYHGARLGIPVTIVMPRSTPNAKVEQTSVFGAEVILEGSDFDAASEFTAQLATDRGLTLLHPFDDVEVIAGQGTLALEMLEQVPDLDTLVVPVGGGGLIAGVATAIKARHPSTRVIGVQTEAYSAVRDRFGGARPVAKTRGTVAEGIAVKQPGAITGAIIEKLVDDVVAVSESAIETAIFKLLEIEKTVTEGAGAAACAAVLANPDIAVGKTAVILSGGNIDMMILSSVLQRGLVRSHRLVRISVELPDVPGAMAELTRIVGELDSNIVDIGHQRAFESSSVRATRVELVLQMRGEEQIDAVLQSLAAHGYEAELGDDLTDHRSQSST